MSDAETPQEPGSQAEAPTPAPESSSPVDPGSGEVSANRSLMIVLSYLWILFLIPLLIEKDDKEVQWHAKHGLVLSVVEFLLQMVLSVTGIGCFFAPFVFLGFSVVRLIAIVKGINGERFMVPVLSDYANRF